MKTYYLKIVSRDVLDELQQNAIILTFAKATEGEQFTAVTLFPEEQIKECTSTYYRKKGKNGN